MQGPKESRRKHKIFERFLAASMAPRSQKKPAARVVARAVKQRSGGRAARGCEVSGRIRCHSSEHLDPLPGFEHSLCGRHFASRGRGSAEPGTSSSRALQEILPRVHESPSLACVALPRVFSRATGPPKCKPADYQEVPPPPLEPRSGATAGGALDEKGRTLCCFL